MPQAQVTIQCDALVEAFRQGENTSKPDVLTQIMRILSNFFSAHPGNDADFSNALRVYVEMLDNCEAEQHALLQEGEGQVRARTDNEAEEEGQQRPRPATPIEDENPGPADRDGDRDGGDESDREGCSGDGRGPAKRPRIDESKFPWQPIGDITRTFLHPELQCTLELVENYTIDLKATRQSVTNSPECPDFPEEQWLALLAGKAVNLEAVFGSTNSTSINEVQTHKMSEGVALRFGENTTNPNDAKQVIRTANEWLTTWHTYAQAVVFAFPHRACELALYEQYMSSFFRTSIVPLHDRIFVLDRAICGRVGRTCNILLSDTDKHRDLEHSHISTTGVAYSEFEVGHSEYQPKKKGADRARSSEACRRWNSGVCPSAAGKCRYKHICSQCKGSHIVMACPQQSLKRWVAA